MNQPALTLNVIHCLQKSTTFTFRIYFIVALFRSTPIHYNILRHAENRMVWLLTELAFTNEIPEHTSVFAWFINFWKV